VKPITVTTTVERPREELFDLIADLRNHEAWTDHMLADWSGAPERVRARSAVPGVVFELRLSRCRRASG
jgi:hypothetical protein